MIHLDGLAEHVESVSDDFIVRATGRYYTHEFVARNLIFDLINGFAKQSKSPSSIKIVDPFGGDGRLIIWLIEMWRKLEMPRVSWRVSLWDINENGLSESERSLRALQEQGLDIRLSVKSGDTFRMATIYPEKFDIVITNPPWEMIKPDRRELAELDDDAKSKYVALLKEFDEYLATQYPLSQPSRKFAGWGTDLSRVGLEVCHRLCKPAGQVGIVLPTSFFADAQSVRLRSAIFASSELKNIRCYPAEARLFGSADVSACTLLYKKVPKQDQNARITRYDKQLNEISSNTLNVTCNTLKQHNYSLPIRIGAKAATLLFRMAETFPEWKELEDADSGGLWAGRELDETGSKNWLKPDGKGPLFIKGRMINRYAVVEGPSDHVSKANWAPPRSTKFARIAWRDVSRPNQKRRMIATIVSDGLVAGNSLGIAFFEDSNQKALKALLGVMNSLCFEFQLRCHLATGHVSLSAIRKVRIPPKLELLKSNDLLREVSRALCGNKSSHKKIEAIVAKQIFRLSADEFETVIDTFDKITEEEKRSLLQEYENLKGEPRAVVSQRGQIKYSSRINNHFTARLSDLDMSIVRCIQPGGNWKQIPESIPSKRVENIRQSYSRGEGSRSTYYGRLRKDRPSYTINTYFSRPGNGCHIHYSQDRVLSQREAGRLQSFPDNFLFVGSQREVNTQIGNAVPPLLAYQIALEVTKATGRPGKFVDLFSGAGGLALGFVWAGWKSIVANDIERRFLETYSRNIHDSVVPGSITDADVFEQLLQISQEAKTKDKECPLWVLGGPPCQGFSTAGKKRSMEDARNHLFSDYVEFLKKLKPDGFVFENVAGLLNMQKGLVFDRVQKAFNAVMPHVDGWLLQSEHYAIPQRRTRVLLVGRGKAAAKIQRPQPLTTMVSGGNLFENLAPCVTVEDAIDDLPPLMPGEDGTTWSYAQNAKTPYQMLMRGLITPGEYLIEYGKSD